MKILYNFFFIILIQFDKNQLKKPKEPKELCIKLKNPKA